MTLVDLFSRLKSDEQAARSEQATTFEQLVEQLSDGALMDATSVKSILEAAGRTADELEAAVADAQHLARLTEHVGSLPQHIAQRDKIEGEIAALREKMADAFKQYETDLGMLNNSLAEVHRSISKCGESKAVLERMCPPGDAEDEAISEELRLAIMKLRIATGDERESLQTRIKDCHRRLDERRDARMAQLVSKT